MENQAKSDSQIIGKVIQISTSTVTVQLRSSAFENPNFKLGSFLIIPLNDYVLFGQLTALGSENHQTGASQEGTAQLMLSINIQTAKVVHGVAEQPSLGANVLLAPNDVLKIISSPGNAQIQQGSAVRFHFASLLNAQEIPVALTPETLFGRHCAIIGTTGAGKSWTVARLLEEASRFRSKVILFDATGEYRNLSHRVCHLHIGHDPDPLPTSKEVVLPFYKLTENDLFAIFQPDNESQAPKLRAAIKSLKLATLKPDLAIGGRIVKANRSKSAYESAYQRYAQEIEANEIYYDIRSLTRQIENECVSPVQSSAQADCWGAIDPTDRSACVPLVSRMDEIIRSETLAPIFKPDDKASLLKEIENFFSDDQYSILRISLEYLSFDHHARELVTNAAGRFLLNLARANYFQRQPLLILLDEAHQFLNLEINNEDLNYALDSFALIAKEGRKYGVSMCIATQRPRDIPEGVISQMGTLIVHRLINHFDRSLVERSCGHLAQKTMQILPTLAPGEAVIVGPDFTIPLIVKILPATSRPHSSGPDYQSYWKI